MGKYLKIGLVIAMLVILLFVITSCSAKHALIGVWVNESNNDTYTFTEDGDLYYRSSGPYGGTSGTYKVSLGTLTISTPQSGTVKGPFKISDDTLEITVNDITTTLVRN